jgi:hypothetical protein
MYIIHFGEKVLAEIGWLAFPTANKMTLFRYLASRAKWITLQALVERIYDKDQ